MCCRDHSWPTGCELLSSYNGYKTRLLNILSLFTQTFFYNKYHANIKIRLTSHQVGKLDKKSCRVPLGDLFQ